MNIPDRFWKGATVAAYLVVAFLAVLTVKSLKEISFVGANPTLTSTITLDGTGEAVAAQSDIVANFSFTVTETAKTVAAAQEAATKKTNDALKAVKDQGVKQEDITTQGYNINPHYEYQNSVCPAVAPGSAPIYCPGSRSVITGYDVSQTVGVKVRDLSKAGALLTSIGNLNVENVNGLSFSVDKPDALQAQARAEAIAKAQAKAKALASQLGVKLVRITSFSEYSNSPRPIMYGMGGATKDVANQMAPVAPEISTGEQKVTSNVSITYEIE